MDKVSKQGRKFASRRVLVVAAALAAALGATGCGANSFTGSGTMNSAGGGVISTSKSVTAAPPVAKLAVTSLTGGVLNSRMHGEYSDTGIPASEFGQPLAFTMAPYLEYGMSNNADVQRVAATSEAKRALAGVENLSSCMTGVGPYRAKKQTWLPSSHGLAVVLTCPIGSLPVSVKVGSSYNQTWLTVIATIGGVFDDYINAGLMQGKFRAIR